MTTVSNKRKYSSRTALTVSYSREALHRAKRCLDGQDGQSVLEMALILPLGLLLLLGAIEGGILIYTAIVLNNAARAGVQYGAQSLATAADIQGMEAAATANAQGLENFNAAASCYVQCVDGSQIQCGGTCNSGPQAVYITVQTSASFQPISNFLALPWPSTVTSQMTMRVE